MSLNEMADYFKNGLRKIAHVSPIMIVFSGGGEGATYEHATGGS